MKYLCNYSWGSHTQNQAEAIRRFKETGGMPPQGANLLGRWTRADFMGGVVLLESNDPKALAQFALMWSDVMELNIVPVVEDQELINALESAGR